MKFLRIALVLAGFLAVNSFAQTRYSQVRIPLNSPSDMPRLARLGLALDHVGGRPGQYLDMLISAQERELLVREGVPFTVLLEDWHAHYLDRLAQDLQSGTLKKRSLAVQNFHLGRMGGHLALSEVGMELDSMHAKYPTLITAKDSIGESIEHRPIWAVKISRNPDLDEPEPRALYTGLHHAREPSGMMSLIYFMWYLLENYGVDAEVTILLDHRELFFVPVVNPDGYLYNEMISPQGGGGWRKNKRDNTGDGLFTGYGDGVDLNRNYGFQWGYNNQGSSPSPASETYRGTSGFSEPETQAVRRLAMQKHFAVALNYHTYSNLLIYPWGYIDTDTEDSLTYRRMGEDMTVVNGYTYGTGGQTVGYTTNGDSDDWFHGDTLSKPKVFSMTPEVGSEVDGFWATPSRIIPLVEENLSANLYFARVAGQYITFGATRVEQQPSSDTLRLLLTFINRGVRQSSSTVQVALASSRLTVVDPIPASIAWQDTTPLVIRAVRHTPWSPGEQVTVDADITYPDGMARDSLVFRFGVPAVLFSDSAESTRGDWTAVSNQSARWDTTSVRAHSGRRSYTESPSGNYPNNLSSTFSLNASYALSGNAAELRFWTRWDIETNYDYATVELSSDGGSTWSALKGKYTGQGSGVAKQPLYGPGYDGIRHNWVEEVVDLHQYLGRTIKLRFRVQSDSWETREGIYIDDIRLLVYPTFATAPEDVIPMHFALDQNYPNPFNPTTTIRYTVGGVVAPSGAFSSGVEGPDGGHVRLVVYDMLGREVTALVDENKPAGRYTVQFNAANLASGVYFYRLSSGGQTAVRRMMLLR